MGDIVKRQVQAIRLERDAFVWMDFNDRATGDALILVAITRFLMFLGFGASLFGVVTSIGTLERAFFSLLNALIFWLAYSGITYAVVKYLFQADGNYPFFLRLTGFAYPTMLLTIVTFQLGIAPIAALILGALWFIVIVAKGIQYVAELTLEKAGAAAFVGLMGWIIVALVLKRGLI